jgi:hypothetical protein
MGPLIGQPHMTELQQSGFTQQLLDQSARFG